MHPSRIVGEAWDEEQAHLKPIPERLLTLTSGRDVDPVNVVDLAAARAGGEVVQHRDLSAYARVAP